ncbi:MAG TPA: hypothetical protein VFB34_05540 [Chloroflexota bacterium]|nr:hypothetical protein [Chloroflexota bacterium]
MKRLTPRRSRVARIAHLAVAAGLLSLSASLFTMVDSPSAFAIVGCRSDPVVTLSNLTTLDISANILDSSSDLRSVTYTLHGPVGTSVLLFVPTDGLIGQVEHFSYVANQPRGQYSLSTYVSTGTKASVTVSALAVLGRSDQASGYSNQTIGFTW